MQLVDDPSFVLVWDLRSTDRPPELVRTGAKAQGLALSPDGRTVYTSLPLTAYDVATGRQVWSTESNSWLVLDISPDGTLLASECKRIMSWPLLWNHRYLRYGTKRKSGFGTTLRLIESNQL